MPGAGPVEAALLRSAEQEYLALAIFLTDRLFKVHANDDSAPAIHLSSLIESEVKRRIFACPGLVSDLANPGRQTLGVLPYPQRSDDRTVTGCGSAPVPPRSGTTSRTWTTQSGSLASTIASAKC
ncbi:MAG: hypothetical protein SNJ69_11640 [Chloroflexaceae bacterium]